MKKLTILLILVFASCGHNYVDLSYCYNYCVNNKIFYKQSCSEAVAICKDKLKKSDLCEQIGGQDWYKFRVEKDEAERLEKKRKRNERSSLIKKNKANCCDD